MKKSKNNSTIYFITVFFILFLLLFFPFKKIEKWKNKKKIAKIERIKEKEERKKLFSYEGKDYFLNKNILLHKYLPKGYQLDIQMYGKSILFSVNGRDFFEWDQNKGYPGPPTVKQFWVKKNNTTGKITISFVKI